MVSNKDDLFVAFNENLELLHELEKKSHTRHQKTLVGLIELIKDSPKAKEPPLQKIIMDICKINSTFKSLNSNVSSIEQKITNFNKPSQESNKEAQTIHMGCPPDGLDLTQALQDVNNMNENDVSKLLESLKKQQ